MSRCERQQTTCPHCGAERESRVFASVNGARIRQAADSLIEGTWGLISCFKCGASYEGPAPRLFCDLPGGLWLAQYPPEYCAHYAELEQDAHEIFQREWFDRPSEAVRRQADRMRRRICFGRHQLVEKLLLRRQGLDDCLVECLKLVAIRDYLPELYPFGPTEFLVTKIDGEGLELTATPIGHWQPLLQRTVRSEAVQAIEQDRSRFQEAYPELFAGLYVSASRYLTAEAAVA